MQQQSARTCALILRSRSQLPLHKRGRGHSSVVNMQLFVLTQELHTLQVMSQEKFAQIKLHVLLEGISPDQICSWQACPQRMPLPGPVWDGGCDHSRSSRPEYCSLAWAGKERSKTPKVVKQEKEDWLGQVIDIVQPAFCQCCAPFNKKKVSYANS